MSGGSNYHINNHGGKNFQHFGTGDQNVHEGPDKETATLERFFELLEKQVDITLPEPEAVEVVEQSVRPLREFAMTPPPEAYDEPGFLEKYYEKLKPHAGLIVRCSAAFTEASLDALATRNPVIAGIVAVANVIRNH